MSEANETPEWPPAHLAVLQNGDGDPSYYRPRETDETLGAFIDRIANTVVRGIVEYPGTAFVEIIKGDTGEPDEDLTTLVVESMRKQKLERRS